MVLVSPTRSLQVGDTFDFRVITYDAHDRVVPSPAVTWSSFDAAVATIASTGVLIARGIGTTTVTAVAGRFDVATGVTVAPPPVVLEIVPYNEFGDTIQLAPGQQLQFSAVKFDRSNNTISRADSGSTGSWGSSRPDVAMVSPSGLVTAVAEGDAQIAFSLDPLTAYRPLRIKRTPGTATVRFVNGYNGSVTVRANDGEPVLSLGYADVQQETIPAGTLFATIDGHPLGWQPSSCSCFNAVWNGFVGLLPADSRLTLYAISSQQEFFLAPLWDWKGPIASDSAMVRVFIATADGANVYLTDPGAPMGVRFLEGCYLDGNSAFTDYIARAAKPFDIVFQTGKGVNGPETARFSVTPQRGTAVTYVFTGPATSPSMRMLTLVDQP
jgi:hypothetical protein